MSRLPLRRWARALPGAHYFAQSARRGLEAALRLTLGATIQIPKPGGAYTEEELIETADDLNRAAEDYFAREESLDYLLHRPYSATLDFPRYMFNTGVLLHHLKAAPGDTVVELGAGSCWLSHFLNLYGCRTVSVDVSTTSLEVGRKLFEAHPGTRWDLEPRFLPYDGHRLPLEDESCDRLVLHDAFHHIPNQSEILGEMARVLKPGGIVTLSEPGREHSGAATSRAEVSKTGVLENDIIIEDLAERARACGFTAVEVIPLDLDNSAPVPAHEYLDFLRGKGLLSHWVTLSRGLLAHHFIRMAKGEPVPDTRWPSHLEAEIEILAAAPADSVPLEPLHLAAGEPGRLRCRLTNRGDTRWLTDQRGNHGWTRLGGHLYRGAGTGEPKPGDLIDFDWYRGDLDREVEPGESLELEVIFPALNEPGAYRVIFDLVAEEVTWFALRGSPTAELYLVVDEP